MTIAGFLTGLLAGLISVGVRIAVAVVEAIPFAIIWNALVPKYAGQWVPSRFQFLPYWHVVGALILLGFIGEIIKNLSPSFVKVEQKQESKKD